MAELTLLGFIGLVIFIVFQQEAVNSLSEGLFFLSRGNVTASGDLGLPYFHVKEPGSIFGEHALLEKPAEFSAIAQVRCELFAIDKSDLATLAATRSDGGRDGGADAQERRRYVA